MPEEKEAVGTETTDFTVAEVGWKAVLFNCNCHSFDDVIGQLIKAIGCSQAAAAQFANIVHHTGSAVVFRGSKDECERVAAIIAEIGLVVTVIQ